MSDELKSPAPDKAVSEELDAWSGLTREQILSEWDKWREYIAMGGGGDWPRQAFESLLDHHQDTLRSAAAFKSYVHQRLDEADIPTHPDGKHSAAGCRVGDRLDIALSALLPEGWNEAIEVAAKHLNDIADEERLHAQRRGDEKSYGAAAVHQNRAFDVDIYAKAIRSLKRPAPPASNEEKA